MNSPQNLARKLIHNIESPKALALDGTLVSWVAFVVARGVPGMLTAATLVLVVIRILIAWREWRVLKERVPAELGELLAKLK
jgi:hypothetical protein